MQFNSTPSYYHSMDRDYISGGVEPDRKEEPMLGIGDVGMSVPMGIGAQNIQGLASHIRMGAGSLEIQFPGSQHGNRNAQTPEMYGEEQRQAIRDLALVNEVDLTTHASYGVMGMSGFTGDNPYNAWFTKEQRKMSLDEVKRAIDFAKDVAGGGSVVVHTGEVERAISEEPWARRQDGTYQFKQFEEEPTYGRIRVVDERTGQVMQQVRKNQRIARPDWMTAENDTYGVEFNAKTGESKKVLIKKGEYVDYQGRKIPYDMIFDQQYGRVPKYDEKTGRFMHKMYNWNEILQETELRNKHREFEVGRPLKEDERYMPEEVYLRSTLETNEGHSRGWALQYGESTSAHLRSIGELKKSLEFYEKLEKEMPKEEVWKIMKQDPVQSRTAAVGAGLVPSSEKLPSELLRDSIKQEEIGLEFARQASASQQLQAEDSAETQKYIVSATKYAKRESAKSYAEAGIHAMQQSKGLDKPLFITMENIFPERYGGHPTELKELIREARHEMVERLSSKTILDPDSKRDDYGRIRRVQNAHYRGVSKEEAQKMAETHIKATLDTGHLNTWRKYWQDNPNKTVEENTEEFKKWMLNEVEDLAKNKMIGNVHLADNMGYQDDHLAPGQGTTPVKDIVKILKKHGYDESYTVEPGADATTNLSAFHGLMTTWRHFGSPIYGMGGGGGGAGGASGGWQDVQYGYFGRHRPPYYTFGAYSPSNDWTLWSQVPLE